MKIADQDLQMFDDILGRCVAGRTIRAARVITRQYDQALSDNGITITQFTLLVVIGQRRPESLAVVADGLDIDRSTLSRNIAKLREGGLLEKSGMEGRAQRLNLTAKGLATLQAVYPKWREVQDRIEAKLGDVGLSKVHASLEDLQSFR